jgi:hypothetical protein
MTIEDNTAEELKKFASTKPVDRKLFDEAVEAAQHSVAKATVYLDIIIQLNVGIAKALDLLETGRHLEARNELLRTRDSVAERL